MALTAAQKKAQKAEEAATKSAYEAAKAALLNNLNTGLGDMKENVANDVLDRGLARSSIPITLSADNETTMRTAYNTDLAGLTANRDSTLAQILARYASMGSAGGGGSSNNKINLKDKLDGVDDPADDTQTKIAKSTSYDAARAEQNYAMRLRAEAEARRRREQEERQRRMQYHNYAP